MATRQITALLGLRYVYYANDPPKFLGLSVLGPKQQSELIFTPEGYTIYNFNIGREEQRLFFQPYSKEAELPDLFAQVTPRDPNDPSSVTISVLAPASATSVKDQFSPKLRPFFIPTAHGRAPQPA